MVMLSDALGGEAGLKDIQKVATAIAGHPTICFRASQVLALWEQIRGKEQLDAELAALEERMRRAVLCVCVSPSVGVCGWVVVARWVRG